MTGALMQLCYGGYTDIYFTGNPSVTFFKAVYRRHTNFSMDSIRQCFSGPVGFGNKVTATIARKGDLLNGLTLEVDLPALNDKTRWTDDIGHHLISEVSIEIGDQVIDTHYSDWLEIWAQLTVPASKRSGYREMIGQSPKDRLGRPNGLQCLGAAPVATRLYIPLQFWFCRNIGLALPIIALDSHEVKVNISFQTAANLVIGTDNGAGTAPDTLSATLYADYIYLDMDERRRFAELSHEYLIEQLQFSGDIPFDTTAVTANLTFNQQVKELIWVARYSDATNARQWSNYSSVLAHTLANRGTDDLTAVATTRQDFTRPSVAGNIISDVYATNPVATAQLKINDHDRFSTRDGDYFNRVQTAKHHTCIPSSPGINVYSFALNPEKHQPSGSYNFHTVDRAELILTLASRARAGALKVFAVNYNILRIMSGMGGLTYSA